MSKVSFLITILVSVFATNSAIAYELSIKEKPSLVCENELGQLADANLKVQVFAPSFENKNSRILVSKEDQVSNTPIYAAEVNTYRMADSSNAFSTDQVMLNVKASADGEIHGKLTFKQGDNLFYFVLKCNKFYQIQPSQGVDE